MTRKEQLIDALTRSFDGPAWHGPALQDALADVTAEEASFRPANHVHSMWELTLHVAGWAGEVANRLNGNAPKEPAAGDWPAPGAPDNDGWEDALQQVFNARDTLIAAVRAQTEEDLDSTVGTSLDTTLGTGFTRLAMVDGVIQHNAYHGGQIMLLKKIIRAVV
ncbi:MAG: DinB family protein [Gemmatimonadota bacterium]